MANRFSINSSHQAFAAKQKNLFDLLENAEKSAQTQLHQHQEHQEMEVDNKPELIDRRREATRRKRSECERSDRNPPMKQYKSRESIFKRPEAPIARCLPPGRVPGFRKNPTQWTKYTLEDVNDEDMSDRSNTQAAFSFLKTLEKNKGESEEKLEVLPDKIVFKKSSILRKKQAGEEDKLNEDEGKCSFRSSKVVMPEYVVGQAVKRDKKPNRKIVTSSLGEKSSSRVQLKLDHLDDEYEDDM